MRKIAALLFLAPILFGGSGGGVNEALSSVKAKNIILFIGDGMGAEHLKAARRLMPHESGKLSMDAMPTRGMLTTHAAESAVTDSAAAATALAAGVKTHNGVVALDTGLNRVPTILDAAKALGKSGGLVTTTQITHATPAAFAAHIHDRRLTTRIAEQILATGPEILLGGGEAEFLPLSETGCFPAPGARTDGRNLIREAVAEGYRYVCDENSFRQVSSASTAKLMGLFADQGMSRPFSPSLAEMTHKAITILSQNPNGFFLMVEAGQIDWASHDNDAANAVSDTIGLDEAVAVARQFAADRHDTLIIVTADHETGGMWVSEQPTGLPGEDGPFTAQDGTQVYVNWAAASHTEAKVPITAQGPFSDGLTGIKDNTHVYEVMMTAFGLPPRPDGRSAGTTEQDAH